MPFAVARRAREWDFATERLRFTAPCCDLPLPCALPRPEPFWVCGPCLAADREHAADEPRAAPTRLDLVRHGSSSKPPGVDGIEDDSRGREGHCELSVRRSPYCRRQGQGTGVIASVESHTLELTRNGLLGGVNVVAHFAVVAVRKSQRTHLSERLLGLAEERRSGPRSALEDRAGTRQDRRPVAPGAATARTPSRYRRPRSHSPGARVSDACSSGTPGSVIVRADDPAVGVLRDAQHAVVARRDELRRRGSPPSTAWLDTGQFVYGTFRGSGGASTRPRPGFSVEAVQTPARVNVTCVTPLGEEVASTS